MLRFFLTVILLLNIAVPAHPAPRESAFERVTRTHSLRCAYTAGGPYIRNDLKNDEVVGPMADIARAMAEKLGLAVVWTEVGYADFAEGLHTGRYDAYCGIISITPARERVALFTAPLFQATYYAFVRADETRFTDLAAMNRADVKAGTVDGEVFQALTRKFLPLVQEVSLPNMSVTSQLMTDLADGKSDVVIHDPFAMKEYDDQNPGRIRRAFATPVGTAVMAFAVPPGDSDLKALLDQGLQSLAGAQGIDAILDAYGIDETMVFRQAPTTPDR